jgi:hypothetical protein
LFFDILIETYRQRAEFRSAPTPPITAASGAERVVPETTGGRRPLSEKDAGEEPLSLIPRWSPRQKRTQVGWIESDLVGFPEYGGLIARGSILPAHRRDTRLPQGMRFQNLILAMRSEVGEPWAAEVIRALRQAPFAHSDSRRLRKRHHPPAFLDSARLL